MIHWKIKTNLRDRDDLSTRDIGHFPKASLSRRFHCSLTVGERLDYWGFAVQYLELTFLSHDIFWLFTGTGQIWYHLYGGPCSWNLHCGATLQGGQQQLVAVQVEQCSWWLLEDPALQWKEETMGTGNTWSTNSFGGWTKSGHLHINIVIMICHQ